MAPGLGRGPPPGCGRGWAAAHAPPLGDPHGERRLKITDEGLRHLGHVTTLDLTWCKQITDKGLAHLGSVRRLTVRACPKVTNEWRTRLRSRGATVD
jgi:hypothetical protein